MSLDMDIQEQSSASKESHLYPEDFIGKTIDFSGAEIPPCFAEIHGISWSEPWGRWADSSMTTMVFRTSLPERFVLEIEGYAFYSMDRKPIQVEISGRFHELRMRRDKRRKYRVYIKEREALKHASTSLF
jgi:hypothetical protein